jgi:hypothetical protein
MSDWPSQSIMTDQNVTYSCNANHTKAYNIYVIVSSCLHRVLESAASAERWYVPTRVDGVTSQNITVFVRGGVRSMRGIGPTMTARGLGPTMTARGLGLTMTARGQNIGISIGMLPQTLIMSRLDQLSRLGTRI